MKKKSNIVFISILFIAFILMAIILVLIYKEVNNRGSSSNNDGRDFSVNFIRKSNEVIGRENYMISPYSVEMALSIVREGANNTTYDEMSKIVPSRDIKDLRVNNRVNVANGLFIKNDYKSFVKNDYINKLKNNYNSYVDYDEFVVPDKINDWVNKETNGMINKVFDRLDDRFVLAIVNAVAMEEEWYDKFECDRTIRDEFNLIDGSSMNVSMMNNDFDSGVSYYENESMKSVVMPYKMYNDEGSEVNKNGEQLEFIGILPNGEIDEYINNLNLDVIREIDKKKKESSSDYLINVSLPKFKFDYDFKDFKKTLIDMGLNDIFSSSADFSNIFDNDGTYFINDAVHKSHVHVDEEGTKAAAVTGFAFKDNAALVSGESVSIVFDKPFIFLIKDTNSDEILFFGVVYEPSKYVENKC